MARLTKEDIIKGKDKHEVLHLDSYDADVVIRPLTDGELGEIFSMIGNKSIKNNGETNSNDNDSTLDITNNFKILRLAASLGLVEPKLTTDEISDMKFGVPELIGTKILKMSGITPAEEIKKKEPS